MIVDIYQDTVCPWCRIGKKHLFDAVSQWTGEPVEVRYHVYLLNPQTPGGGVSFHKYMESIKGPGTAEMLQHVTRAGEAAGLVFRFDRIEKMPNTIASHQLIKSAPQELQSALVDAIYQAYFEDGRDIGDSEELRKIAAEAGLDEDLASEALKPGRFREEIENDISFARANQISGVPFFVINGRLGLSGAHPVENFLKAFRQASGRPS